MCLLLHTSQGCFCPRNFFENSGLNMMPLNSLVSISHCQLGWPAVFARFVTGYPDWNWAPCMWCDVVIWCGVVWRDVNWPGGTTNTLWYDKHDIIWYHLTYDMTSYDTTWSQTVKAMSVEYDIMLIWFDTIHYYWISQSCIIRYVMAWFGI